MTPPQDPNLDTLVSLSSRLSEVLSSVETKQFSLLTPCSGWDLSALIDHVVGGNWFTDLILSGLGADEAMVNTVKRFDGDSASIGQAVASVSQQLAAFEQSGSLGRTWHHVVGDLTGRQVLRLRLHDLIVHTWDIEQTSHPQRGYSGGDSVQISWPHCRQVECRIEMAGSRSDSGSRTMTRLTRRSGCGRRFWSTTAPDRFCIPNLWRMVLTREPTVQILVPSRLATCLSDIACKTRAAPRFRVGRPAAARPRRMSARLCNASNVVELVTVGLELCSTLGGDFSLDIRAACFGRTIPFRLL